jgi:hypothetical protein
VATLAEMTTRTAWTRLVNRIPADGQPGPRRKHRRRSVLAGTVELNFEQDSRPVVRSGRLLNISKDGVSVKLPEKVDVRTPVITCLSFGGHDALLAGDVIYCTETAGGCRVGIQLRFENE